MSKKQALIYYTATMALFQELNAKKIITNDELQTIDTMIAEKYGISSCSIYR